MIVICLLEAQVKIPHIVRPASARKLLICCSRWNKRLQRLQGESESLRQNLEEGSTYQWGDCDATYREGRGKEGREEEREGGTLTFLQVPDLGLERQLEGNPHCQSPPIGLALGYVRAVSSIPLRSASEIFANFANAFMCMQRAWQKQAGKWGTILNEISNWVVSMYCLLSTPLDSNHGTLPMWKTSVIHTHVGWCPRCGENMSMLCAHTLLEL